MKIKGNTTFHPSRLFFFWRKARRHALSWKVYIIYLCNRHLHYILSHCYIIHETYMKQDLETWKALKNYNEHLGLQKRSTKGPNSTESNNHPPDKSTCDEQPAFHASFAILWASRTYFLPMCLSLTQGSCCIFCIHCWMICCAWYTGKSCSKCILIDCTSNWQSENMKDRLNRCLYWIAICNAYNKDLASAMKEYSSGKDIQADLFLCKMRQTELIVTTINYKLNKRSIILFFEFGT